MSNENSTGEQMRKVVEEINASHQKHASAKWEQGWYRIEEIEHLYTMPVEAYIVTYTKPAVSTLYIRTEWGVLTPAPTWSYYARDNFEDTHDEQASAPESEAHNA